LVINLIGVYSFSGPNFKIWLIISTITLLGELCLCDLFHVTKWNHVVWYTVHCIREMKPSRVMVKFRTQCSFHQCNFHIVCVWVSLYSKQWYKLEQWGIWDYLLEWVPTEILMETCCTFRFLNQWYYIDNSLSAYQDSACDMRL